MSEVAKNFVKYVGLNTIGMISTAICILVDYWFIATAMGTDGLAALSIGLPVYSITWGIGMMLGVGGGAKYAELQAVGKEEQANKIFTMTMKLGVIVIIPLVLTGIFLGGQISSLLGGEGHILPMVTSYVRVILLMSPGLIIYNIFESFTRNDDAPKAAMISSVIYNIMNLVLDALFIFGFGWGMFGAALATTMACLCALLYLVVCWRMRKTNFRLVKAKMVLGQAKSICEIGLPSFNSEFLYGFIHITFNLTLLSLAGYVGVAAFGIVSSVSNVAFYMFSGIGQGIQPLASYYYGMKESVNLKKVLNYSVITSVGLAVITIASVFLFADAITSFLNTEQDAILSTIASEGVRIYFIAYLFVGITTIAIAFLSVTSAPKAALVISVLQNGALLIPLVFIMSRLFGIYGAWASYPVSELLLVIVSLFYLSRANKNHRETL